jgi:glyoxylase-like metal-dependent hydrolase (beta-lactamase superfamily II)
MGFEDIRSSLSPRITAGTVVFKCITIYPTFKTRRGEKAIRYLVLTHHHMDHVNGARVFAAKGADLIFPTGDRQYFDGARGRIDRQSSRW